VKEIYLETSVLLTWLFGESKAQAVTRSIHKAKVVCTSRLTLLEAQRNLIRQECLGRITSAECHRSFGLLEQISRSWLVMEINSLVTRRAAEKFPIEPVRSLDAIHLASALQFLEIYPKLEFSSLDGRIQANLGPLGFAVAKSFSEFFTKLL